MFVRRLKPAATLLSPQSECTLHGAQKKEACNASLFFNSLSFLLIRLENLSVCLSVCLSVQDQFHKSPPWNHQQDICKFDTPLLAEGVSLLKSKITLPVKEKINIQWWYDITPPCLPLS
jgi:hypothetical protein